MPKNKKTILSKKTLIFLLGIVFLIAGLSVALNYSRAVTGVPVIIEAGKVDSVGETIHDATEEQSHWWEVTKEALRKAAAIAYRNGLKAFLNNMARDTAQWIAEGAPGKGPMFLDQGFGDYIFEVGMSAGGTFAEDFTGALGGELEDRFEQGRLNEDNQRLDDEQEDLRTYLQDSQDSCKEGSDGEVSKPEDCREVCYDYCNKKRVSCSVRCNDYDDIDKKIECQDRCQEEGEPCVSSCFQDPSAARGEFSGDYDTTRYQMSENNAAYKDIQDRRDNKRGGIAPGGYMETQPGRWGRDLANTLCQPSIGGAMMINFGLAGGAYSGRPPTCTLKELEENWDSYIEREDFLDIFQARFDPNQNDLGIAFQAYVGQIDAMAIAEDLAGQELQVSKGWKGVGSLLSTGMKGSSVFGKKIFTPSDTVKNLSEKPMTWGSNVVTEYTGEVVADAIGVFTDTLLSRFLQNIMAGQRPAETQTDSKGFESYALYEEKAQAGVGRAKATEEYFKQLYQPNFSGGGSYEVIQKLAQCKNPDDPAYDTCVISESFRGAIEQQKTVKQAVEEGLLDASGKFGYLADGKQPDYETGYPYRSLVILRKFRIIPVGWELAALYVKDFGHEEMNLGQVIAAYDDVDSPFYKLVDPNWVLKAPEHFCRREGPGQEFSKAPTVEGEEIYLVRRDDFCVDEQSCIRENDDGSCQAWGYCTEEKRVWNFPGEACSDQYNTCRTYTNSGGQQVSYLENTLDWNSCSIENVDCMWYCQDYNPVSGDWVCLAPEVVKEKCDPSHALYDSTLFDGEGGCQVAKSCDALPGEDFCFTDDATILSMSVSCPGPGDCEIEEECDIPLGGTECRIEGCSDLGNLVVNSGFENGTGTDASEWAEVYIDAEHYQQRTTDKAKRGEYSIKSFSLGIEERLATTSAPVELETNNYYVLKASVYNSLSQGEAKIEVVGSAGVKTCYKGDKTTIDQDSYISVKENEWEEISCYFSSGTTDEEVTINLVTEDDPVGSVWFDALELVRECQLTPLKLTLGSEPDLDSEMYFDVDAVNCEADEVGCSRFVALGPGINYVKNPGFSEKFEGASGDGLADDVPGWQGVGEIVDEAYDANGHALRPITENIYQTGVETGEPISKRTFTLSLYAKDCTEDDYYYISEGDYEFFENTDYWQRYITTHTFAEDRTGTGFNIFISIDNPNPAVTNCLIDSVMVEENDYESSWADYGQNNNIYFKKAPEYFDCEDYLYSEDAGSLACEDYSFYCTEEEVGCELYTPVTPEPTVPGIAGPDDYCPSSCVGYDTYKEEATNFRAADWTYLIPTSSLACNAAYVGCEEFTNLDTVAAGGEAREIYSYLRQCRKPTDSSCSTYYTWEGDDESGFQLATHLLVKDTTDPDEAPYTVDDYDCELEHGQDPDCREFYNDKGKIFYRRYSQTTICHDDCHPYRLTGGACAYPGGASDGDDNDLDGETDEADECECEYGGGDWRDLDGDLVYECIYQSVPSLSSVCKEEALGCREYVGNTGYNKVVVLDHDFDSELVDQSEEWTGGDSSWEQAEQGGQSLKATASSASKELISVCRLYSEAGTDVCGLAEGCACNEDAEVVDPETDPIECLVAEGEKFCTFQELIRDKHLYELSFWALGPASLTVRIEPGGYYFNSDLDEDGTPDPLTLINKWRLYNLGPVELGDLEEGLDYELIFSGLTSGVSFIDNIILTEIQDSVYLIKDSWDIPVECDNQLGDPYGRSCGGSETDPRRCSGPYASDDYGYCSEDGAPCTNPGDACGTAGTCQTLPALPHMLSCQEYTDRAGQAHDLRSFSELCSEKVVGCEAFIDTHNLISAFGDIFSPGDAGVTIVPEDEVVYLVNDADKSCSAASKGCQAFGLPDLDQDGRVEDYATEYIINDPDHYTQILCGSEEVGCKEFASSEGIAYFKEPEDRTCEYKQLSEDYGFGWYKQGTVFGPPDCPVIKDPEYRTIGAETGVDQPVGECVGGTPPTPNLCFSDEDCPGAGGKCASWVGLCPEGQSGCTEYVDPVSYPSKNIIFNGNFEQLLTEPSCDGWTTGSCVDTDGDGSATITTTSPLKQTLNINPERLYILSAEQESAGDINITISNCGELSVIDDSMNIDTQTTTVGEIAVTTYKASIESDVVGKFSGRFYTKDSFTCTIDITTSIVTDGVAIDDVELKEAMVDYQIADEVDKAGCNGVVNPEAGCILLNERSTEGRSGYRSLSYDAQETATGATPNYCIEGEAGCLASSNTLVKVTPDRTCDKWLYCSSAAQLKDPANPQDTKERCFEVGLCNSLDENLNCDGFPFVPDENLTFSSGSVDQLKDLSGYGKAGFDWGEDELGVSQEIEGFLPVSKMQQTGGYAQIPNADFEEAGETGAPLGWSTPTPLLIKKDSFWVINKPAESQKEAGLAIQGRGYLAVNARLGPDDAGGLLSPSFGFGSGIVDTSVITTGNIPVIPSRKYVYSALINTKNLSSGHAVVEVIEFNVNEGTSEITKTSLGKIEADTHQNWQRVVDTFTPDISAESIKVRIYGDSKAGEEATGYFYLDDIQIKPSLELQKDVYEPQSCRLYPKEDSFSCDYQDEAGYQYHGNYGYCLETDPNNSELCELWWPVENILGDYSYEDAYYYYGERQPLYYCLDYKILEGRKPFAGTNCGALSNPGHYYGSGQCLPTDGGSVDTTPVLRNYAGYDWYPYSGIYCHDWQGALTGDPYKCAYIEAFMAYCDTVVQVVTPSGDNKAWAGKLNSQNTDSAHDPFGGAFIQDQGFQNLITLLGDAIDAFSAGEPLVSFILSILSGESVDLIPDVIYDIASELYYIVDDAAGYIQFEHYYDTDYAPFGSIVAPIPEDDPTEWSAMPIDQPYCPMDIATTNIGAAACVSDADCKARGRCIPAGDYPGLTILEQDFCSCSALKDYKQAGQEIVNIGAFILFGTAWDGRSNIPLMVESPNQLYPSPHQPRLGIPFEITAGNPWVMIIDERIPAKFKTKEFRLSVVPKLQMAKARSGLLSGGVAKKMLMRLFAQSYGVWKREPHTSGSLFYNPISLLNWDSSEDNYPLCDDTYDPEGHQVRSTQDDCVGSDVDCDLCAVAPRVTNIEVNDKADGTITLKGGGFVTLKFNAEVDTNQLPLTSYKVDWADGSVTGLEGVSMQDKPNEEDPYIIYHYYSYWDLLAKWRASGGDIFCDETEKYCRVTPQVQVKDNWGWCNNYNGGTAGPYGYYGKACDTTDQAWAKFGSEVDGQFVSGTIEVRE